MSDKLQTVTCHLPPGALSLSGHPQVSSWLSRAARIHVARHLPMPPSPGSSGAPAPGTVRASARRAAGCRCWASWSPCSRPAPGGPRQLGRGAEGETAGLSWERQPSAGKVEEPAAGASENVLLFFSHTPNANRCFLFLRSLHALQPLSSSLLPSSRLPPARADPRPLRRGFSLGTASSL